MGALRHGLGATCNDYLGIARDDSLGSQYDSLDTGCANLIYSGTHCVVTQAGIQAALSSWILPKAVSVLSVRGCKAEGNTSLTLRTAHCQRTPLGRLQT